MLLEAANLVKTFRTASGVVRAVDGVSLTIDAGEFVAIKGPSGCGKTTLLLVAGGLLAPDDGLLTIAGENPYALPSDRRAQFRGANIGFVFQQFHLVPYLSVLDNIIAPSIGVRTPAAKDRARELMAKFGLEHRARHTPGRLSTGERQRTAFARALFNQPKIILADEPTGNLDRTNAEVVMQAFAEFTSGGGAVLLVTHDDYAVGFAQRVLEIQDGKLLSPVKPEATQV